MSLDSHRAAHYAANVAAGTVAADVPDYVPAPVDAGLARKLAAAVAWHQTFLERGDKWAAECELAAARKYADELLGDDAPGDPLLIAE